MAKPPDSKKAKDPARPTRAKAAREHLAPIAPHLEKLLNPGIAKGTAGVGSQTGLNNADKPARRANEPLPGGEGLKEKGALMLVPSTAVESMGLGGMLGAAANRQTKLSSGEGV